jgi:hypothetical protein
MRAFFLLLLAANVVVFAIGRGWLGTPPSDAGRTPGRVAQQLNADAVTVLRQP